MHHAAVFQPNVNKAIESFDRTHKARLHKRKNALGYHIAYHYIIGEKWETIYTRPEASIWYINSDRKSNSESIGVCLVGNFDERGPTPAQMMSLERLIGKLKKKYKWAKINGHRDINPAKSCPGRFFPLEELKILHNYENIMSYFKDVRAREVPVEDRNFTVYDDKRPMSVEDTKYLLDIVIMRDNKKDKGYMLSLLYKLKDLLKRK